VTLKKCFVLTYKV